MTALAFLVANWRMIAVALALTGAIGGLVYVRNLQHASTAAKTQAAVATQTAQAAQATTQAVSRVQERTNVIHSKAEVSTDAIHQAPGADALLPPAVLDAWRSGIVGLRNDAAGGASADHP